MDFPYSPVRLMVLMLPAGTDPAEMQMMRTIAGLSYLISIISLACFGLVLRLRRWPGRARSFNVWVNLPTFDPTAGGDVVARLQRDARFNIALGFLLPFVTPALLSAAAALFGSVTLESPQTLIWTVTAWAFLPASLFMRGIAMGRVAELIEDKRRQTYAAEGEEDREELQPV